MRFSLKIREFIQQDPGDDLRIVNYDTVTFEVDRVLVLGMRGDDYGTLWAPRKQYFFEIHQDDNGCIPDIRLALLANMEALQNTAGTIGVFTLWIKGRRYSEFSYHPKDWEGVMKEVYAEVDSDMSFNREEWGLTQEQRKRACSPN